MLLYAANGGIWAHPVRVSYSFVPDGTSIGGPASNLYATLNATQSTAAWQGEFKSAAALWETYANVNLALVPDNGAILGVSGNQQGDPRFGDIRISMFPQQPGVLALAFLPPPINGGTDAGDINFNSNINWSPTSGYDLESVALHELGHALGLDHSAQMNAVMYAYYSGTNQNPTSDDISGIQSVYGAIPAPAGSNHTIDTAWNLSPNLNSSGQLALANQSILGVHDADWWRVTAPANTTGTLTVQMQASNLSSLAPKLVVLDGYGNYLGMSNLPDAYGATAQVTVTGIGPNQNFFIKNLAASGIGSSGAYGLLVNFGSSPQAPIAPPNTVVAQQPDKGGGGANELINQTTSLSGDQVFQLNNGTNVLDLGAAGNQFKAAWQSLKAIQFGNLLVYGEALTVSPNGPPAPRHLSRRDAIPLGDPVDTHSAPVHDGIVVDPVKPAPAGRALPAHTPAAPGHVTGSHSGRVAHASQGAAPTAFPDGKATFSLRNRSLSHR